MQKPERTEAVASPVAGAQEQLSAAERSLQEAQQAIRLPAMWDPRMAAMRADTGAPRALSRRGGRYLRAPDGTPDGGRAEDIAMAEKPAGAEMDGRLIEAERTITELREELALLMTQRDHARDWAASRRSRAVSFPRRHLPEPDPHAGDGWDGRHCT